MLTLNGLLVTMMLGASLVTGELSVVGTGYKSALAARGPRGGVGPYVNRYEGAMVRVAVRSRCRVIQPDMALADWPAAAPRPKCSRTSSARGVGASLPR